MKGYKISAFIFCCFIFPSVCPHCFFQVVIDEGQKVGSFFQGDLNRAGKLKVRHDSVFLHGKKYLQKSTYKRNIQKTKMQDLLAISHIILEIFVFILFVLILFCNWYLNVLSYIWLSSESFLLKVYQMEGVLSKRNNSSLSKHRQLRETTIQKILKF